MGIMKVQTGRFSSRKKVVLKVLFLLCSLVLMTGANAQIIHKKFTEAEIVDKQFIHEFNDAESHFEHHDYSRAVHMYEDLINKDAKNPIHMYKAGICYLANHEEADKALEYMEEAKKSGVKLQHM